MGGGVKARTSFTDIYRDIHTYKYAYLQECICVWKRVKVYIWAREHRICYIKMNTHPHTHTHACVCIQFTIIFIFIVTTKRLCTHNNEQSYEALNNDSFYQQQTTTILNLKDFP